ncbi:hypothetical protein M0R45_026217 [Rubus argutus]|uniref:Aminotransferase-like plant mobile domain-containing protein n=1 Tax=Rubus argutus TaxID=59490 RepID=A0AAW1WWB7_RUBAR
MDAQGRILFELAPDKSVRKQASRLEYKRSLPSSSILIDVSPNDKITLVSEVSVNSGLDNLSSLRGRAIFELGVIEWTKSILDKFGNTLDRAGIFGAVGVSCYPYHYCVNTWRAFLELWGPLTSTLHYGNREMSVSLHDLKLIGGLPIVCIPYEEFISENKEMRRGGPYPSTLTELLCIHSQLCELYKQTFIRWEEWITHFYRGKLLYAAYGENAQQVSHARRDKFTGSQSALKISKEGELAAFQAFWLSRFVLPSHCYKIRPETFYMACLMAQGDKISLAPSVLRHIYHGLGEIVTEPRGPDMPVVEAKSLDITSVRLIFRTNESVDYRPSPFIEQKEQYYPNRFACQFGFDQGVPSNKLQFGIEKRRKCCIEDLAKAQRLLLRTGTGTHFYISCSTYNGACTWAYCRWWMRACAPYLGRFVSFVYLALKKHPLERKSNVLVIKSLREVSSGLRRETLLSDVGEADSTTYPRDFPPVEQRNNNTRTGKHTSFSLNIDEGKNFKRACYQKCDDSKDETVFPQDNYILDEDSVTPEETKQDSASKPRKTESKKLKVKVQKPEPKLKKPAQKHVVKSPLKGTKSKTMDPMSESQQVESELRDLGPQLKETEPRLQLEGDSESVSGGTEPIGSDPYVSENIHEDTSSMIDISSYLHEECQEAKKNLDLQLLDLGQQLTDLKATEHSIREVEEQAQRLREAYETARDDLEEQIRSLKETSKCQIKLDEELRQARINAQEDKLLDLEHAESL